MHRQIQRPRSVKCEMLFHNGVAVGKQYIAVVYILLAINEQAQQIQ